MNLVDWPGTSWHIKLFDFVQVTNLCHGINVPVNQKRHKGLQVPFETMVKGQRKKKALRGKKGIGTHL